MSLKIKLYIFRFAFSGLFFALIWWAADDVEGKSFDFGKFVFRFLLFGTGMTLVQAIVDGVWGKKKKV